MSDEDNLEPSTPSPEDSSAGNLQKIFKPGESYGEYRVIRCLTAGLLANYYQMQHEATQEEVTVGVFHGRTLVDSKFLKRLRSLEKQMSGCAQEGMPKIRRCDIINHQHCIILDPIKGQPLSSYFAAKIEEGAAGMDSEVAVEVLARLMGLLGYAHVKGLDHRDLDSDLIFVDEAGNVSVLGFGIKAAVGYSLFESIVSASVSPLAASTTVGRLNSFDMISPEYRRGKEETQSVDLFAVGMIGYWLLTSRKASVNEYSPPSEYVEDLPEAWDSFFEKLIKRFPEERYASFKLALVGLRSLYKDRSGAHEKLGLIERQIDRIPVPKKISERGEAATRIYRLSVFGLIGLTLAAIATYFLVEAITEADSHEQTAMRVVEAGESADLQIAIEPPEAEVVFTESGKRFNATNGRLDLLVPQGKYRVEVSSPNYVEQTINVEISGGELFTQKVVLRPKWSHLQIDSNPLTTVSALNAAGELIQLGVTGEDGSLTVETGVFAGTYTIIFEKAGYKTERLDAQELSFDQVTELETSLDPMPSVLVVRTAPIGAKVFVEGRLIGEAPIRIEKLDMEKPYTVRVELEGYREVEQTVSLDAGEERELNFAELEPKAGALRFVVGLSTESELGWEAIRKDLIVEVGDEQYAYGADALDSLPEGMHRVRLVHPLYESEAIDVQIVDRTNKEVYLALKQLPGVVAVSIPKGLNPRFFVEDKAVEVPQGELTIPSGRPVRIAVQIKDHVTMSQVFDLKPKGRETWQIKPMRIPGPEISKDWVVPYLGMKFESIPEGSYTMGSPMEEHGRLPNEGPLTVVTFTRSFWAGKYEVTQFEYLRILSENPSEFEGALYPVESVSWAQARAFCKRLTEIESAADRLPEGYVYRLPTEYEWEYFARGGSTEPFHFGDFANANKGNFKGVYPRDQLEDLQETELYGPTEVGSYEANGYGIHDVHGNVQEWTLDTYNARLKGGSLTDPSFRQGDDRIAVRGGSWQDSAVSTRAAFRREVRPETKSPGIGFRVVLAPKLAVETDKK